MEETNEITYFKNGKALKNLVLSEVADQPYLIHCIKEEVGALVLFFSEGHCFSDVRKEMMQRSLFGDKRIFVLLSTDEYTDQEWEEVFQDKEIIFYFLKTRAKKSLVDRFKRDGGVLSLLEEKSWDRKNRLVKNVIYAIHKDGVMISQPTAYRFVERVYTDLSLFYNELSKLRSFARGKKQLSDFDVDEIVKPLSEENSFKVTDDLIWKGQFPKHFIVDNASLLLQMLGAMRFQAYLGLKLLSSESVNLPLWQEKKYKERAERLGDDFFKKILKFVFKAEGRVKQTSNAPAVIFTILSMEIVASVQQ